MSEDKYCCKGGFLAQNQNEKSLRDKSLRDNNKIVLFVSELNPLE